MALFIQTPRNDRAIASVGPYRRHLNALTGAGTNIQRRLSRGGLANYEPDLQATLLALAQSPTQRVFYDVGAHIGFFSALLTSVYRGNGLQAFAFEPTPSTFQRALQIRDQNHLGYAVQPCALSNTVGTTQLYLSTKAETSNSLNSEFRPGSTAIEVRCETIDSVVEAGLPPPTLVKIDVETFEPQVLLGGMKTIRRHKPWISCEFLADTDKEKLEQALEFLEELGYGFHQISSNVPWERLNRSSVMGRRSSKAGSRDWLVAPKDLSAPFFKRFRSWRRAVGKCDLNSNIRSDDKMVRKQLRSRLWEPLTSE